MNVYALRDSKPKISPDVGFIADDVTILGDVEIGEGCTIFSGVVLEGLGTKIKIGKFTNIQSGTVIHGLHDSGTKIGNYNTIGHNCVIHGCTLKDFVTIGIGSIVMGKTTIGRGSLVGAGSLVTERKNFPERSLILGHPAKLIKKLDEKAIEEARKTAELYYEHGIEFKKEFKKIIL
nr:gamma carbonic anhydrase family protein [Candidatus Prometheoarchaeum syntrophicum]QEE16127.1 putative lipopolysaccharide biosynthesis O-acetyl transferase WbbJ [Candidatus Prometheoarchaeum syntrophicum]